MQTDFALDIADVSKTFTMHLRGGVKLPVISHLGFAVAPGECVVLSGPSGAGKSSILKMIYGTYGCDTGRILLRNGEDVVDIVTAEPRKIIALRRDVIGYVTQFLHAVPRVPTIDIVMGSPAAEAAERDRQRQAAAHLLQRLNLPERLWTLAPATFSGGEQQRVNIARGLLSNLPVILLDEPTASLDARNRAEVVALIKEKKQRGSAIVAIVHDEDVRDAIADRLIDVSAFSNAA